MYSLQSEFGVCNQANVGAMSSTHHVAVDVDMNQLARRCLCRKLSVNADSEFRAYRQGQIRIGNGLIHAGRVEVVANAQGVVLGDHAATVDCRKHRYLQLLRQSPNFPLSFGSNGAAAHQQNSALGLLQGIYYQFEPALIWRKLIVIGQLNAHGRIGGILNVDGNF